MRVNRRKLLSAAGLGAASVATGISRDQGTSPPRTSHDRLAEALIRAQHALTFANGHVVHDGKPDHPYTLDFSEELKFIDEMLEAAGIQPRPLEPLKSTQRKEVYCETCGSDQPMIEHKPQVDKRNPHAWYDITCGTCYSIVATVQVVPIDKPIEHSRAVTSD